jgi:hypothetical protein
MLNDNITVETSSSSSNESLSDLSSVSNEHKALDFKLIVDDVKSGQQVSLLHLTRLYARKTLERRKKKTVVKLHISKIYFVGKRLQAFNRLDLSSTLLEKC